MDSNDPVSSLCRHFFDLEQLVDGYLQSMELFDSFRSFEVTLVRRFGAAAGFGLTEHRPDPGVKEPPGFNTPDIFDIKEKARVLAGIFSFIGSLEAQRVELKVYSVIHPLLEIPGCAWRFEGNAYHSVMETNRIARTVMMTWLQKRFAI